MPSSFPDPLERHATQRRAPASRLLVATTVAMSLHAVALQTLLPGPADAAVIPKAEVRRASTATATTTPIPIPIPIPSATAHPQPPAPAPRPIDPSLPSGDPGE